MYPLDTLVNALKLVIAVLCIADTVVVPPATADIPAVTVNATVTVVTALTFKLSLTANTTLLAACTVVGVPDTRPVVGSNVTPDGSVPELVYV